jgi:hypothetical protein
VLVILGAGVAAADLDFQFRLKLALLVEGGDDLVGVMGPSFVALRKSMRGSRLGSLKRTFLRLSTMSVTSSTTPGRVANSWTAPSSLTLATAAPSSEESSTRRSELPRV